MPDLEKIKSALNICFPSKPIEKAWLFGSYARGEETSGSDIDILVDYGIGRKPGLFTIGGIIAELEEILNTKIDLIPQDCIYEELKSTIEKDKILIYERKRQRPHTIATYT